MREREVEDGRRIEGVKGERGGGWKKNRGR